MTPSAVPAALIVALLAVGCQSSPTPRAAPIAALPTPSATPPVTATRPPPTWVVGRHPLPLRADGFGKVLATPKVLRNRRLVTADVLPPPADGRFHYTTGPITSGLRHRMGDTYRAGCPVPLSELRYLTLTFRGFDGRAHTGELVVAATAAPSAVRVFRALFKQRFPLEQMRLPTTADLTARPTGDGNNTAGFVCRAAVRQTRFSAHAYGLAIDVNPFDNPYVQDGLVLPELASSYANRSWVRPGMFVPGSAAVRAFTLEGWTWGGTFRRPKDYQHFSLTGN